MYTFLSYLFFTIETIGEESQFKCSDQTLEIGNLQDKPQGFNIQVGQETVNSKFSLITSASTNIEISSWFLNFYFRYNFKIETSQMCKLFLFMQAIIFPSSSSMALDTRWTVSHT